MAGARTTISKTCLQSLLKADLLLCQITNLFYQTKQSRHCQTSPCYTSVSRTFWCVTRKRRTAPGRSPAKYAAANNPRKTLVRQQIIYAVQGLYAESLTLWVGRLYRRHWEHTRGISNGVSCRRPCPKRSC